MPVLPSPTLPNNRESARFNMHKRVLLVYYEKSRFVKIFRLHGLDVRYGIIFIISKALKCITIYGFAKASK